MIDYDGRAWLPILLRMRGSVIPRLLPRVAFTAGLWASAHIVLYKRDSWSAIAWVGLVLLVPLVGSLFYYLFGMDALPYRCLGFLTHAANLVMLCIVCRKLSGSRTAGSPSAGSCRSTSGRSTRSGSKPEPR